jgi:Zn finger protein HypA/HybF involved in hydrogenase expression
MSRTNKPEKQGGMDGLIALARQLEQVKAQARTLGIFTDDRELLKCPNCGLLEDVMANGLLVTYSRRSRSRKDCGLRFSQAEENRFQCPSCGTKIRAVML